jgi:hypothetical protein
MTYRRVGNRYTVLDDFGGKHMVQAFESVLITKTGATARVPSPYRTNEFFNEAIWRDEEGNLYREVTIIDFHGHAFYRSATAEPLESLPYAPCEIDGTLYKTYAALRPRRDAEAARWRGEQV